jgi:hypothetical protein
MDTLDFLGSFEQFMEFWMKGEKIVCKIVGLTEKAVNLVLTGFVRFS